MDLHLAGRVAVVTGAARGIGRGIALTLAAEGAQVAANYRERSDAADDLIRRIEEGGGKAAAFRADVGRYHEETPAGVLLHDVAEHRDGPGSSAEEFVRKMQKYGVRAEHRNLVVPSASIRRLSRLLDWSGSS